MAIRAHLGALLSATLEAQAQVLSQQGRWAEAAALYEQMARETQHRGKQLQALIFAGDALRRDDRPARAARVLQNALPLAESGPMAAPVQVQLADILMHVGELEAAHDLAVQAMQSATSPGIEAVALDTLIGILATQGQFSECAVYLERLRAVAPPPARSAVLFREATALRRAGDLDGAEARLDNLGRMLSRRQEAIGAAAAAATNIAEICLFRGDAVNARRAYDMAAKLWTTAGRRAGLYRCEAGMVRASLLDEETPLPSVLDTLVDFAVERQMVLLEAHLRIVRGAARARAGLRGGDQDLGIAVSIAARVGCRMLEGRARLARRRSGFLYNDEAHMHHCLRGDACWSAVAQMAAPMPW